MAAYYSTSYKNCLKKILSREGYIVFPGTTLMGGNVTHSGNQEKPWLGV